MESQRCHVSLFTKEKLEQGVCVLFAKRNKRSLGMVFDRVGNVPVLKMIDGGIRTIGCDRRGSGFGDRNQDFTRLRNATFFDPLLGKD